MNESFIHCTICMPRTEEANQKIREEQRQKILNAAQTIFAQKGRTATMTDIAAQAGISQGLAYRYFKSKEEIFSILLKQAWAEAGGGPAQRIGQIQGTPGQRLTLLITYILESIRPNPRHEPNNVQRPRRRKHTQRPQSDDPKKRQSHPRYHAAIYRRRTGDRRNRHGRP